MSTVNGGTSVTSGAAASTPEQHRARPDSGPVAPTPVAPGHLNASKGFGTPIRSAVVS